MDHPVRRSLSTSQAYHHSYSHSNQPHQYITPVTMLVTPSVTGQFSWGSHFSDSEQHQQQPQPVQQQVVCDLALTGLPEHPSSKMQPLPLKHRQLCKSESLYSSPHYRSLNYNDSTTFASMCSIIEHQSVQSKRSDPSDVCCSVHTSTSPTSPTYFEHRRLHLEQLQKPQLMTTGPRDQSSSVASLSLCSSPLRSSHSFSTTVDNRQRSNVTVIRRKSASERLQESSSNVLAFSSRLGVTPPMMSRIMTSEMVGNGGVMTTATTTVTTDQLHHYHQNPSVKPSSHSSSGANSNRFSPISDQHDASLSSMMSARSCSLVDKINSELNRYSNVERCCSKRKVCPKNSCPTFGSGGISNLELQLRELITIDSGNETSELTSESTTTTADVCGGGPVTPEPVSLSTCDLDKSEFVIDKPQTDTSTKIATNGADTENLYRAELKYIASSSSSNSSSTTSESLSSMYSEPAHQSLSPVDRNPHSDAFTSDILTPSVGSNVKSKGSFVQRTDSDASSTKNRLQKTLLSRTKSNLDSPPQVLVKSLSLQTPLQILPARKPRYAATNLLSSQERYSSENDLSNSLSTSSDSFAKNSLTHHHRPHVKLAHSKSISKLTIENLLLHQQNLKASKSCQNLIGPLQTGPSVVERNARIIKWLFNCRKAMTQSQTSSQMVPFQ